MDIENPLHKEDEIPEAKLVYIEVTGQLMRESLSETYNNNNDNNNISNNDNNNAVNVEISFTDCIYYVCKGCFSCVIGLACCFGFVIFLFGSPFS
jgi:hypothetical protein